MLHEVGLFDGQVRIEFLNRILAAGMLVFARSIIPAGTADKSVWFGVRLIQACVVFVVLYAVVLRLRGGRWRAVSAVARVVSFQ